MLKSKLRFVYMILAGLLFVILGEIMKTPDVEGGNLIIKVILSILSAIIIWEGNLRIDNWLNINYPWMQDVKKRLVIQLIISPIFTITALYLLLALVQVSLEGNMVNVQHRHRINPLFLPGLFIALLALIIDISSQFFKSWRKSLLDVEKYKTESAEAQLQNLKSQLNPHFLFNNLSVLSSLVYKNQEKAVDFINELSKVYRYVLENKNAELVTLEEELAFLSHYTYLLKIRFENSVSILVLIDEKYQQAYVPPMCLQMLVENAIQHNEASEYKPLNISVYTNGDRLIVQNNIQPRLDKAESSKTGIRNIESRYLYFTDKKVEIVNDGEFFKVTLPIMLNSCK